MARAHARQIRMGRVLSLAIWASGVGMLFPACSSSGLAKGSTDCKLALRWDKRAAPAAAAESPAPVA